MDNLSKFLETHRNIAKIFPKEWFESELKKSKEVMHVLAKQFKYKDDPYNNSISNHIFDHLDEYLGNLEDDIQKKGSVLRKLKNSKDFADTIGQIEICSFLKKLGFNVELEPKIPDSKKISDIKISNTESTVYIEVMTLHERQGEVKFQSNSVKISTIIFHPNITLKNKIKDKSQQLSEIYPGIIVICLDDSIPRTFHIDSLFQEIAKELPIISGLMLYYHSNSQNGCLILIKLLCNPFATKPIPVPIKELFDSAGITITSGSIV